MALVTHRSVTRSQAAAFSLDQAAVDFGPVHALGPVSLEIEAGEIVAFVGPSGSGKTTLLRLLNATLQPTSGRASVDGVLLGELSSAELRRLRSQIGTVHQDLALVPNLRVIQNVVAGRLGQMSLLGAIRAMARPKEALELEVHEILERVGIGEKLYARTDTLSLGQQQRVAIARALHQAPRALLADEPISSVDPARARDTLALLTRLSREAGLTLCMSLHDLKLAREFFPRVVGLRAGRIALDGAPDEIDSAAFDALYHLPAEEGLASGG